MESFQPNMKLEQMQDPLFRPNKESAVQVWRRLVESDGPNVCPFSLNDCELILDAINLGGFIVTRCPHEGDEPAKSTKILWRFFVASFVAEALDAILPNADAAVVMGTAQHAFSNLDPEDPEAGEMDVTDTVAWVMTNQPFAGGTMLVDPMGWSLALVSGRDIPKFIVAGMQTNKGHTGSQWNGEAYLTGLMTRLHSQDPAYLLVAEVLRAYRIPAWRCWEEE